jgi:hypothetical protein
MLTEEQVSHWSFAERCRRLAVHAAETLRPAGIELVAIKGLALAYGVAEHPWLRPIGDADVLVGRGRFRDAVARLQRAGLPGFPPRACDATFGGLGYAQGAWLDLHGSVLPQGTGGPVVEAIVARARPGPEALAPLLVPDAADAAAIGLAHWAKDGFGRAAPRSFAPDVLLLQDRAGLTPGALGERLAEHGLRRIGALAFGLFALREPRFDAFRAACAPTAVDDALLEAMRRWGPHWPSRGTFRVALLAALGDGASPLSPLVAGALYAAPMVRGWASSHLRARAPSLLTKLSPRR